MSAWWRHRDLLPGGLDQVLAADLSADVAAARILRDAGLACQQVRGGDMDEGAEAALGSAMTGAGPVPAAAEVIASVAVGRLRVAPLARRAQKVAADLAP